jgi:hypothetical protein
LHQSLPVFSGLTKSNYQTDALTADPTSLFQILDL